MEAARVVILNNYNKDLVINAIDSMGLNMGRAFGFASRRLQEDSDVRAEFFSCKE
jgi:hypothetical protein